MRKYLELVLGLVLFTGCAQVGTLSGGETDVDPPRPIENEMDPPNRSTNFTGQKWEIPFNEYISLNNPNETFIVLPANIKPEFKTKGKKLTISWDEALSPNTTYAFYLNGTVNDITEKNDSLYVFVFSTGDEIDSVERTIKLVNALDNTPVKKGLIGLYSKFADTLRPSYIGMTNDEGIAKIQYIQPLAYEVFAFEDKNRNLLPDADESFGFLNESISFSNETTDTVILRVSPPLKPKGLRNVGFLAPDVILLSAHQNFDSTTFTVNGQNYNESAYFIKKDSVHIFVNNTDTTTFRIKVDNALFSDSSTLRVTQKERAKIPSLQISIKEKWTLNDSLRLTSSARLIAYDSSLIRWRFIDKDTSEWESAVTYKQFNDVIFAFPNTSKNKVQIQLLPQSLVFSNFPLADTVNYTFDLLKTKDLGQLTVLLKDFPDSDYVLELLQNKQTISKSAVDNNRANFMNILPGEYTIRILVDDNKNGVWDGGNYRTGSQPERYIYFPEIQKIRPNWDNELELNYEAN